MVQIFRDSIIMVDFGETVGSVQNGTRPAIVVQNDIGNKYSPTTIVVPITAKKKKVMPTHYELSCDDYCCLKYNSTILAEQIVTISKEQIFDVLGHLNKKDSNELNKILNVSINLSNLQN
ncbi:MAG: type II toxin-antitoxin system PemK/MazF family toxin [Clostridiales bacterium]|nr:type II toxin-antitoxin system PemK/MazF family toxin [Clostridiales bacterium]